jgi:hypothetical protein
MLGRLSDGELVGYYTRARSKGGFGGESPDMWASAISVCGVVTGGWPGSHTEMGRGAVEAGRHRGK